MELSILQNTLQNIDWPQISKEIANNAYFYYTQQRVENNPLIFNTHDIDSHYIKQDSFIKLLEEDRDLRLIFFENVNDSEENHRFIDGISKGFIGDFKQLNFVCNLLENFFSLKEVFKGEYREYILDYLNRSQRLKAKFIKELRQFVKSDGSVQLERHPRLKELISKQNEIEMSIRQTINYILKSDELQKRLQFDTFDIVNERYVIPIRSDSYKSDLGIIVSRSSTGHTLFVEPKEVRNLCNQRMEVIGKIEEIINDICTKFTNILLEDLTIIKDIYKETLHNDYVLMQSMYAYDKQLTRPITTTGEIDIRDFFHPMIEKCVLNDLNIKYNQQGLIISGPNTGGKTVTIKSVILVHIFNKLGFYVPAREAQIPFVNDIFYFDSDYQNLTSGMSSFAGETHAILEMIAKIDNNSLIAADEIFNSTSSDEASALAISIIEFLTNQRGSKVLISTHHQLLKTKMQDNPKFVSAHVGFEFSTNQPTYKLITGTPGSSMALKIFSNLSREYNVSSEILKKAENLLDQKYVTYEKLLQDLSKNKSQLDALLSENRQLNFELKNQKKSMEGLLFLEKERAYSEYKQKLEKELQKLRHLKKSDLSINEIKKRGDQIASQVNHLNPNDQRDDSHALKKPKELIIGNNYFSQKLQADCVLVSIDRKKANVKRNGMNIKVPLDSLYSPKGLASPKRNVKDKVRVNVFKNSFQTLEIKALGKRLDEFQREVEDALDHLLAGDIPYLLVVHGHGNGVLKGWLRSHLKKDGSFDFSPEEGNDGATRITVKSNKTT